MNKSMLLLLLSIALFFGACGGGNVNEKLTVASQQGDCVGVMPMKCLLVKAEGQTDWQFFYSSIEGFEYGPGFEYVLEVKVDSIKNPAADQSSLKYTLVREISKEEKVSEGLPQIPVQEESLGESDSIPTVAEPVE